MTGAKLCIIPVEGAAALAWAQGRLSDYDLLMHVAHIPEAVFVVSMEGRVDYRLMCDQVAFWRQQGAVCLAAQSAHPAMQRHMMAAGAVAGLKIGLGEPCNTRFFMGPAAFDRWVARFSRLPVRFAPCQHSAPPPKNAV